MLRPAYVCLFYCVLIACPVQAQDSDSTHVLPGITVVDRREPFYGNDAAAFVTEISGERLEASGARTVADALAEHGGAFVRSYGPGGAGGVSVRGTGPSQTTVFLDGLPVASPQLGQVDLSLLPTFMLSRVEVLHGGASSLAGGGAVGGVLSLRSLDAPSRDGVAVRLRSTLGAWGERGVGGQVALGGRGLRAVVAGEASRRDGDFSYRDPAGFSTTRKVRRNADRATDHLMARVLVPRKRSALEIAGWIMRADRGLPGLAGSVSSVERQEDEIRRIWLRYRVGGTTLTAGSQRTALRYVNPALAVDDRGTTITHSMGLAQHASPVRGLAVDFGADVSLQSASHPSLPGEVSQRSLQAFVSGAVEAGALKLLPSLRGDWIARSGASAGQVSPGIRLALRPTSEGRLSLRAGISSSFRAPTLNDLYWRSAGAAGNPDLRPEQGLSADAGAALESPGMRLRVAAFQQSVTDQITWVFGADGLWRPQNVGRVRTVGIESSAAGTMTLPGGVDVDLSGRYTLSRSQDRTDPSSTSYGHPLRYVPAHLLRTEGAIRWRAIEVGASFAHTSRRYLTSDGTEWLPPYSVVAARLSGRLETGSAQVNVALHVENLTGREYEVMSGYPMPPRHARLQITLATR